MSNITFYCFLAFGVILGVAADLCRLSVRPRRKSIKQYRFGGVEDADNCL